MKGNFKKIVSVLVCTVMLMAVAVPTTFAAKVDFGKSAMGFLGDATIGGSDNKVLTIESGKTENWTFKTDADVPQSYTKDIIVSADVKGDSGATLTMTAGQATYTLSGTGASQNVALVIYPKAFEYEVFVNNAFVSKHSMTEGNVAAISSASFAANGGNFDIDNLKVEQWDKFYADSQLKSVYAENFDNFADGGLKNQNGWFAYSTYGSIQGTVKHGNSGKAVIFSEKPSGSGTSRYSYTFGPAVNKDAVVSMWLYVPTGSANKLDIMLRNGTGGDRIAQLFVEKDYAYSYELDDAFRNTWNYDTWFNLQVVLDWDEKIYNIYIDGKKQNEEPISFTVPGIAQFDTILFESVSGIGNWYVDDIEVSTISDTTEEWTTQFEDKFENGLSAVKGSALSVANTWYYGSRNSWNPANALYSVKDITAAGIAASGTEATGNVLEIDAKRTYTTSETDITGENIKKDNQIRSEALVLDLGNGYSKNFRVKMDLYAANYSYKNVAGQESIRRDNLRVSLANNYNYDNGNNPIGATDPYVEFENAGVKINSNSDNAYNQNAWNNVVINVDENKVITTTLNGKKGSDSSSTLSNDMTDLVIYVNYPRAGWWFVDNVKIESLSPVPINTDLTNGVRKLLIQNTIDEMYADENSSAYYVEGLYYTKNKGASYEAVPDGSTSPYILGKAVVANNTGSDLANANIIAAVYEGNKLVNTAVSTANIVANTSAEINFIDKNISCTADNIVKLFVWENETLVPVTDKSFDLLEANNNSVKKVFVVSDSLSAPYDNNFYPRAGWGELIGNYLDQTEVQVVNYGLGGRSSKSFYNEEGCWSTDGNEESENNRKSVMNTAKAGDWVLLSFAHNDEKADDDGKYYTNPYGDVSDNTSYKYWLNKYYEDCRNKGINLALITPMPRRLWNNGKFRDSTFLPYVKAMKEFAAENNIPVVDNYNAMKSKFLSLGEEGSKSLFLNFNVEAKKAEDEFYRKNSNLDKWLSEMVTDGVFVDDTHTSIYGATVSVETILRGLGRVDGFAEFILK